MHMRRTVLLLTLLLLMSSIASTLPYPTASTTSVLATASSSPSSGIDLIITDIIMPDISKCGGLSECRKIANMAEIYYVPFAPHNNSGPLSTLADAHASGDAAAAALLGRRDLWFALVLNPDGYGCGHDESCTREIAC